MMRPSDIIDFGADYVEVELASNQRPFHGVLARAQNVRQDGLYADMAQNVDLSSGVIAPRGGCAFISRSVAITSASVSQGATSIPLARQHGFDGTYRQAQILNSNGSLQETVTVRLSGESLQLQNPLTTGPYPAGSVIRDVLGNYIYRGLAMANLDGSNKVFAEAAIGDTCTRVIRHINGSVGSDIEELYVQTTATQDSSAANIHVARINGFAINDIIQIGTGSVFRLISGINNITGVITVTGGWVTVNQGDRIRVVSRPGHLRDHVSMVSYGDMLCGCQASDNRSSDMLSYGRVRPWCLVYGYYQGFTKVRVVPLGVRPMGRLTATITAPSDSQSQLSPGTYHVVFTFYSSLLKAESEPSYFLSINISSGQAISITFNDNGLSAEQHVDEIRVYRSYVNTPGVYYRVPVVRSGGDDISTINHAPQTIRILESDITLGPQLRVGMNTPPPSNLACLSHWEASGRLCGAPAGSSYVFYSDVPDIATGAYRAGAWPSTNYFKVGGSDPIMGLVSFRDGLLVIKQQSTWFVSGVPPNITVSQIYARDDGSAIGASSRTSIAVDEDVVFIVSNSGAYMLKRVSGFDGLSAVRLDENIVGKSLAPTIELGTDKYPRIYVVFNRCNKQLWVMLNKRAYVGTIVDVHGGESLEWVEYNYGAIGEGAPDHVNDYTTCAIVTPNIFFPLGRDRDVPVVCVGYDESILAMQYGQYDAERMSYQMLYSASSVRISNMERVRVRKINVTCGVLVGPAQITTMCSSDEMPNEIAGTAEQHRKNPVAFDGSGLMNVDSAPDLPSTPQFMMSVVGSVFNIRLALSGLMYVTRLAAVVQPLSPLGRNNVVTVADQSQYAGLP